MQVAVLACLASASAAVVPAAYAGYGYAGYPAGYAAAAPYAYGKFIGERKKLICEISHDKWNVIKYSSLCPGYTASLAAQPVAYAHAPVAGVYAGVDPSVAYANLCKFSVEI